MVTVRSCIASSSAACVLGGVRLTSSARRSSQKIGPRVSVKAEVWKLKRLVPRMSPGIRSGVNWMRLKSRFSVRAKQCAISVFAVPGGPSSSTWPPENSATSSNSSVSCWPTTTLPISARIWSANPLTRLTSMNRLLSPAVKPARHPHQVGAVFRPLRLFGELAQCLGRPLALGQKLERAGELLAPRLVADPDRAGDHVARRLGIAVGHAVLAPRHGDEAGRIVGEGLFAEGEDPLGRARRAEARRRMQPDQEC